MKDTYLVTGFLQCKNLFIQVLFFKTTTPYIFPFKSINGQGHQHNGELFLSATPKIPCVAHIALNRPRIDNTYPALDI